MSESMAFKILFADDDDDDQTLVEDAISECGENTTIQCVNDGQELIEYLKGEGKFADAEDCTRPSIILLDLNMPRKDGRTALREIKNDPKLRRIPIVVLTTSKEERDVHMTYDLGVNSFIQKPATFDALIMAMKSMVDYWSKTVLISRNGFHR